MTLVTDRYEREMLARRAWKALEHGGHDRVVLQVQCAEGHHLVKVFATDEGPVVMTTVRAHSHGSRDFVDEPHTPHDATRFFDLLEVEGRDEDEIPAWCDCGPHAMSRTALRGWIAQGEARVVVD